MDFPAAVRAWAGSNWHFFFLGAAFLLLEVQNISKSSVVLGNTWQVNAVIVSGVLVMILLANLFVLVDGMFFVQSRIAMNDVYTGFFIIAAYALFAWLWIERRRARAFWLLMPAIGVLLGLMVSIGASGIVGQAASGCGRPRRCDRRWRRALPCRGQAR